MNDSMDQKPNILNELRALNHKRLYEVWQDAKDNNMDHLSEEEQEIGKCMLEHEEYHNQLRFLSQCFKRHGRAL